MSDIKHIAIIVDGNRRWAKQRSLSTLEGHKAGYARVKELARWIFKQGVPYASFYLFSRENWSRSKEEVAYLFDLLDDGLRKDIADFVKDGIKLRFAGGREQLRQSTRDLMAEAESQTAGGANGTIVACINYGGQQEIVEAVQALAFKGSDLTKLTPDALKNSLTTAGLPAVDLMIRTSGEQRISNFLLWDIAYAELYFTPKFWPDFRTTDLDEALVDFTNRKRRFGGR